MSSFKKVLLYVITFVIGAIVVLYMLGGKTYTFEASVSIAAPPSVVFGYLTDTEKIKKWVGGVVEIEPLTTQGHEVGAQSRVILENAGMRVEFVDEVLQTVPSETLLTLADNSMFQARNAYRLEATKFGTDGSQVGTRLSLKMEVKQKGFYRFMSPFLKSKIGPKLQSDLDRLKGLVEREKKAADKKS